MLNVRGGFCLGFARPKGEQNAGQSGFQPPIRATTKVLIYLNGALVPRDEARVSVFDAGFVLGDGVWEGLRLHKGALLFLDAHLDRLYDGARAIALDIGLSLSPR